MLRTLKTLKTNRSVLVLAAVAICSTLVTHDVAVASTKNSGAKKPQLRESNYYYGAFNRRDPFRSLVAGTFVRNDKMALVELGSVELVGVVKGELDRFALLEDNKGFSYILRVGDAVRNGTIVAIGDQTMVARVTNFGQTSKYTLHLVQRQAKKE